MNIEKSVRSAIRKWGNTVKICENGQTVVSRGFIQPLRYKNNMYLGGRRLDAGFFDGGHYLYVGNCDCDLTSHSAAVLTCMGKKYTVKRAECFTFRNQNLYVWAVLKPYFPPMEDDYDRN